MAWGDSWCLGCSSGEALTKELAGHWASAGARTLAEDLILSTVRQVRFLRNLTQGIQSNQRASAQAVSQRAKGEPPERPELARKRPAQASTAHHTTAPKSKANKDTKEESPVHYEEESVEEEETESEAEDPRPVGDGARRPPEPPGPPPGSRTASAGGRHSNRAETSKKESKQSHRQGEYLPVAMSRRVHKEGEHFSLLDLLQWSSFATVRGDIVAFDLRDSSHPTDSSQWVAFMVIQVQLNRADGSLTVEAKSLGGENVALSKELSQQFNRKRGRLHFCASDPCLHEDLGDIHVRSFNWYSLEGYAEHLTVSALRSARKWAETPREAGLEEVRDSEDETHPGSTAEHGGDPGPVPEELAGDEAPPRAGQFVAGGTEARQGGDKGGRQVMSPLRALELADAGLIASFTTDTIQMGLEVFTQALLNTSTLGSLGCSIAWLLVHVEASERHVFTRALRQIIFESCKMSQVGPRRGSIFPIPLGKLEGFKGVVMASRLSQVQEPGFAERWQVEAWLFCALAGLNGVSGSLQPLAPGPTTKVQGRAVASLTRTVERFLHLGGQRRHPGGKTEAGRALHEHVEDAWDRAGLVSSVKKRVSDAETIQELGAWIDGSSQTISVSGERFIKLIQATLYLLNQRFLGKKLVQIVVGRWVHALQFRRPVMGVLQEVWNFVSAAHPTPSMVLKTRRELWNLILLAPCVHTFMGARIDSSTTASDASMRGGAVGVATELGVEGRDFVLSSIARSSDVGTTPILVLSLFNGIGGCFRIYDILDIRPLGLISVELFAPANRIVEKRWPQVKTVPDVRLVDLAMVKDWLLEFPSAREIHLWAGFPCVDLSSAKAFRQGLEGPSSSLVHEIPRIEDLLRRVSGSRKLNFILQQLNALLLAFNIYLIIGHTALGEVVQQTSFNGGTGFFAAPGNVEDMPIVASGSRVGAAVGSQRGRQGDIAAEGFAAARGHRVAHARDLAKLDIGAANIGKVDSIDPNIPARQGLASFWKFIERLGPMLWMILLALTHEVKMHMVISSSVYSDLTTVMPSENLEAVKCEPSEIHPKPEGARPSHKVLDMQQEEQHPQSPVFQHFTTPPGSTGNHSSEDLGTPLRKSTTSGQSKRASRTWDHGRQALMAEVVQKQKKKVKLETSKSSS
ncbi:unnamed protein product [Durusdinium trenchii]|uniref:DNA (cytosine-5-)-methyltransferase n=1 Tax=Durusdinium trenchii TaxID=1381693 RepID=A0ABP0LEV3_9DINO